MRQFFWKRAGLSLLTVGVLWFSLTKSIAASTDASVITVTKKPVVQNLYYSGIIKPLTTEAITSSEAGTIQSLNFEYGQPVKKGQLLFTVESQKFQSTLVGDIKTYLSAKRQLSESKSKLDSDENLLKYGLIARNSFESDQTTYYNNELAYLQAEQALVELLNQHQSIKIDFEHLRLQDIDKLKQLLSAQTESVIKAYASASGIALTPSAATNQGLNNNGGSSPSGPVIVGSAVQQHQAVLTIGNLSGATIDIDINEVNVNQITPGLKAVITSMAFPGMTLIGKVVRVGAQATSQSTGIPTFPVNIVIPTLSKKIRQAIRVGMSAKVQLEIKSPPQLQVPMTAVTQKGDQAFVSLKTANGVKQVPVITGATSQADVVIRSGLKAGDQIVLPH